ncbi:MAG: alanine--tRNA ligase [Deltaproteobacteria bacterium]|nr:alanine--tRNA ligase [Deltaproteobacteria bacterium]
MITTSQIRRTFLEYFRSKGHEVLPSAPLVPEADPTLMFTNAGMVQFKDVFTGARPKPGPRAATVQKCIRISGKHNDLENVGRTSRHHTFFEMLGNFSFGDYFKEDACAFAWELLTRELELDPQRLWVSVFAGSEHAPADEEAADIWRTRIGVRPERILRLPAKDNFWAMGDTGPCGPCSEIHYDRGDAYGPADPENGERFFELWNLVFMQYHVEVPGGALKPLPAPCIDTGAGLERIASVLQGVDSNYDIDVMKPLVQAAAELSGRRYGAFPEDDVSMRVIADHARMTAFLVAEGVFPEKTGREYVLRRVMRRAIRHGHRLGIGDLFLHKVAARVVDVMGDAYPELGHRIDLIDRMCRQEEERFRATLERGLDLLKSNADWLVGSRKERILPGAIAFDLSATYGFPKDLIEVIGAEDGFTVDEEGWARAEERHKVASGAGKSGEEAVAPVYAELHASLGDTRFTGYESGEGRTQILAVIRNGETVEEATMGEEAELVLAETPFYGESGGQVGDTGTIISKDGAMDVTDTVRPVSGLRVHKGRVSRGRVRPGDEVTARVDAARRNAIRRHHTATHLLHMALRQVLGPHATQKGSRVGPDSLRFDFAHFEPLSAEQLTEVERLVTVKIVEDHEIVTEETTFDEARGRGAMAIFEETYGDVVRLVSVSGDSRELCGGTHASRSGEIGPFFVVSEGGVAAGVRRIEAVAGLAAFTWATEQRRLLERAAGMLKTHPSNLEEKVEKMLGRERELARELDRLKRKLAGGGQDLLSRARDIGGVRVLAATVEVGDPAALRDTADSLRQRLGSGVVCLGGDNGGKAAIVVAVTADLATRLRADVLIKGPAALVGGRGGGRADLAQAGGPGADKLAQAVEAIYNLVAEAAAREVKAT